MKLKDILTEEEIKDMYSEPLPKADYYPEMPSSSPYYAYRFGMGMANHKEFVENPPNKNSATIVQYTRGEEEIVADTESKLGKFGKKKLTDRGSDEPNGINTVSPVAKPKRNRYGV